MLKQLLIAGTSLRVSEMTLGTMNWGSSVSHERMFELYDLYRAAGGNVLDTAHLYACWQNRANGRNGLGASEEAIGHLLKNRDGERRRLVIISKGGHPSFAPDYVRQADYLSPELVRKDLTESLSRLGLPMIDLYFLHRDDRRVPAGEIVDLLNELVSEGRIRYFGASNWSAARIAEANAYATREGLMGFVASQPEYSLAVPKAGVQIGGIWAAPEPADDLATRFLTATDLAWHHQTGFAAFCYSPTARGYFATGGTKAADAFDHPETRARLARAQELAAKKGATANQIALAWLRGRKFPAMPIVGPSTVEHLKDALGAAEVKLSEQETEWLAHA
jgi:aryl-alcohol dehydrogenase-like predicted oxidoreductase